MYWIKILAIQFFKCSNQKPTQSLQLKIGKHRFKFSDATVNEGGATVVIIIFIESFSSTLGHAVSVNLSCVAVDEGEVDKIYPSILKINPNPITNQTNPEFVYCLERVT